MIRLSTTLAQRQKRTEVFAKEYGLVTRLIEFTSSPSPSRIDWNRLNLFPGGAEDMLTIIDHAVSVLSMEDSLVSVPLPCRVYGDIHGQLPDLVQFFNKFSWPHTRKGDIFSMNYVFLGDFVDRGAFSVEVAALLLSLKVIYPTKIALVRGNHEDRSMNANYGFLAGAKQRFGAADGELVWEKANEAFEYLPLAAIVEECHADSIGDNIHTLDDLSAIPKPITVPACSVAPAASTEELYPGTTCRRERVILDALWSDPTENDNVLGIHLSPRGQSTCRFGPDRVAKFCERNDIKLIIRAHECVKSGHEYFASGLLLTVFSATNYCNVYQNDGAMIVLVVDPETGEIDEHAQVIKCGESGQDTSIGWNPSQFRSPSPLRNSGRETRSEFSAASSLSNTVVGGSTGGYSFPFMTSYPTHKPTQHFASLASWQHPSAGSGTSPVVQSQQQQQNGFTSHNQFHTVSSASRLSALP
ncbi:bsu-protein phosphatase, putative [Perkinsus marinus ATCC 50983]|uniref:Serine/threonine-protein phosphatase n=1 Tax=Perkinsus marinus (strain ATCC 50983 / TXsc) TaxID=423536 RepID=C5KEJ3_PERM5|nr:bsu-protein phosphatase, putative [Perkinsus marinus ATCC 50983]EER17131.1 bsu-protein phosphatase, putative [Perkinsus marinus ATCC 50983]|eukprot:XP_002785335.1 bsu-protein phosphatase, putative [Perkinsus marinus ATCC 50983]